MLKKITIKIIKKQRLYKTKGEQTRSTVASTENEVSGTRSITLDPFPSPYLR